MKKMEGLTSWVISLVLVEKHNSDIRIYLGMKKQMKPLQGRNTQFPQLKRLQKVSYDNVFFKLDLNMAFHQMQLHLLHLMVYTGNTSLWKNMATEK